MHVVGRTVGPERVRRIPRILLLLRQGRLEVKAGAGIQPLVFARVVAGQLELQEEILAGAPVPARGHEFAAELVRRGAVPVRREVTQEEGDVERRSRVIRLQRVGRAGLVVELEQTAPHVGAVVDDVAAEQFLGREGVRLRDGRGKPKLVPHQRAAEEGLHVRGGVVLLPLVTLEEVRVARWRERRVLRVDDFPVAASFTLRQFRVRLVL